MWLNAEVVANWSLHKTNLLNCHMIRGAIIVHGGMTNSVKCQNIMTEISIIIINFTVAGSVLQLHALYQR